MVNIYKFLKKEIFIKPPGEPREQQFDQKVQASQNFIKDKMTGRVDILIEKIAKKV